MNTLISYVRLRWVHATGIGADTPCDASGRTKICRKVTLRRNLKVKKVKKLLFSFLRKLKKSRKVTFRSSQKSKQVTSYFPERRGSCQKVKTSRKVTFRIAKKLAFRRQKRLEMFGKVQNS